jgi:hypothetical protein
MLAGDEVEVDVADGLTVDAHRAAILAGLAITDELFQARAANSETARRLESVMERLVRLLPPSKRGFRAQDAVAPGS